MALLASCSGGSGGSSGSSDKSFTYWSMWQESEAPAKALKQSIAEFEKQTGITVKVQWQGRQVLQKLQPTLNGSPAADLIEQATANVQSIMVPTGTAADLSAVYDQKVTGEDKTVGQVIPEKYQKLGTFGGKVNIIPFTVTNYALWYNAAKTKPSASDLSTWASFLAYLKKQKEAGQTPISLDGDIPTYNQFWYTALVVNKLGPGSFHAAAGDKTGATWDQPGYLEAAQQVEELAKGGYFVDGYDASKFPAGQQKWATNKAQFMLMGSWLPQEVAPYAASGATYAAATFPNNGYSGDKLASADIAGWVVPAKSDHKAAAEKFIEFMYQKDQIENYAKTSQTIVARPDVTMSPVMADPQKILNAATTLYNSTDSVVNDYADWNTKVFQPLNDKLIKGKLTAAQFIAQVKSQSVSYWKRNS
ncbi:hypothetical protein GCM10023221_30000 [Luteimicrobium xylanilyticum]